MKKAIALKDLPGWYEGRQLRERIMLLVCLLVVLFFLWDALVMSPIAVRKKQALSQLGHLKIEMTDLQTRQQLVEMRKDFDPDRENRERLQALRQQLLAAQQQLEENIDNLISPQDMVQLLREMLLQQQQLKLVKLENLPVQELRVGDAATDEPLGPVLYRHRLELVFSGKYLATLRYLQALEKLPRKLVWDELEIETEQYPTAKVRLSVYTMSLNKGWIGG